MSFNQRNVFKSTKPQVSVEGVNSFATQVYGWMSVGLALTAFVAWFTFKTGLYIKLMPFWWVTAIGTFLISMGMVSMINRLSFTALAGMFLSYASLQGIFFGCMLPGYAAAFGGQIIWAAFATAAIVYGIAILYGVLTKSDLTSLGRILSVAMIGLIAITLFYVVLSMFMPVTKFTLIISYLGLVIFTGLTAYDANQIKKMSEQVDGYSLASCKLSLVMALKMYINVIMIFWYLLQIFSSSNRR
ncbi:MAG: Inner membrane protein YbhL [Chlamydiae bacterium]|nr:Inner membrane protein YbhL [Chlamydiota bacterium]